ncbi:MULTISPECIES: ABC transporter substrate-binding protein [unclassified Enterococcus]|uniref:ABC transporter substrate-binding protein n=1 Tax=unclassified Enterococcus TaxID=2608891 RepID=UPI000A331007|nr:MULTISPECIES: ABC transporter substrate-binding protein [unclassified Enterococcus]MBO0424351.1 ABC transporter substrate-binding protein [Enterococcus faecium]OTO34873.1 ABC transporter substrate-binding protein [Enterococcus sp. 2G9_DIV0600]OTO37877.1 ABC transporter substrate-binding protein [Enterococcus sp. 2F9_DIV0599]
MKMKKWITTGLLTASLLALAACGESSNTSEENDGTKTVGVLQLVEHGSLNAAYEGFKEGLAEAGYTEGENLTIEYQNAQNSQDNLKSMSERLVNASPDLLLGIATPAAVSLANETTDTPIVVTAVTDLVGAKLADSNEEPGRNITGTSDMVPIEQQINLLLSIVPDAKTIGILYNAGEANSKIQADLAEEALKAAGVDVKVLTANTTNDVQQVTTSLAKDVDGIYVPTDNTFASAAAIVGEVAKETKTPIVAGSVEQVDDGALATYGIDYKSLGIQTGKLAAKILDGDAEPATTPVETADNLELVVNEEMAAALGIDPASITAPE